MMTRSRFEFQPVHVVIETTKTFIFHKNDGFQPMMSRRYNTAEEKQIKEVTTHQTTFLLHRKMASSPSLYVKILCTIGLTLSSYALYVEQKTHTIDEDEEFQALCDIESIGASCR